MNIRRILPEDLPEIFRWFGSRKWPYPPVEDIAPEFGFVAEDKGELLACAWAYLTGRSLAMIDWTATNPDIPDHAGMTALINVIDEMKQALTSLNPPVRAIVMFTQNDKLADKFTKMKFKKQGQYQRLIWTTRE